MRGVILMQQYESIPTCGRRITIALSHFGSRKTGRRLCRILNSVIRLKPSFFDASVLRVAVNAKLSNYNVCLADLSTLVKVAFEVRNHLEQAYVLNGRAWLRATCPDSGHP